MDFEFKKLSDVNIVETVNSGSHVLMEDGGEIVKVASNKIGTLKTINGMSPDANGNIDIEAGGRGSFIINGTINEEDMNQYTMFDISLDKTYDEITEAINEDMNPILKIVGGYFLTLQVNFEGTYLFCFDSPIEPLVFATLIVIINSDGAHGYMFPYTNGRVFPITVTSDGTTISIENYSFSDIGVIINYGGTAYLSQPELIPINFYNENKAIASYIDENGLVQVITINSNGTGTIKAFQLPTAE